ncbi:MAG: DUF4932 domain-containing protein [Bacteroidaceae bacterium]|nr:DUF4932 domain-containing protein [Bacteroidaceae bacterium]
MSIHPNGSPLRRLTLVVALLLSCGFASAQKVPATFNECTDLMSIIWRLAGAREYSLCALPEYASEADRYFAPYKQHEAVVKAREYYQNGIGYDAVAAYSLHIVIGADSSVVYHPQVQSDGDASFRRWTAAQQEEFIGLANDFYKTTRFHQWYESTEPVRLQAQETFDKHISQQIDYDWFRRFFGETCTSTRQITLSLLNGQGNYGCSTRLKDGTLRMNPIIGCSACDSVGCPIYRPEIVPLVIHEFCHAYCNPFVDEHMDDMRRSAERLFQLNETNLRARAYGNATIMLYESLVRSCVLNYQMEHTRSFDLQQALSTEKDFCLVPSLTDALQKKTARLDESASVVVNAVNRFDYKTYAKQKKREQQLNAKIKCSIRDGQRKVAPGKVRLELTFSKPMQPSVALHYGQYADASFPDFDASAEKKVVWSADQKKQYLLLDLKPATHYAFSILGGRYRTLDGHSAGDTMYIHFWTK